MKFKKLKVFKRTLSLTDFWSLLFVFIVYIIGWVNMPTITTIPEGVEITNSIMKRLYLWYDKNYVLYIIIMLIVPSILSALLFFNLKVKYIEKYKTSVHKEDTYERFIDFLDDAREVFIFGGDLNFLLESQAQLDKIKTLGSKCKIICEDVSRNSYKKNIKELYKELYDAKVQIRCYNNSVKSETSNFRGQLKCDNSGVLKSLLVKKISKNNYEPINIDNQHISTLWLNDFEEVFTNGRDPLIEYIIFDLGGVYFDGDYYEDFLNPVCTKLGINIEKERKDKLLLDEKLNLGQSNIVDYVQSKVPRCLNDEEKKYILETWKNVWKPNQEIKEIIDDLTDNNYHISAFSNLDKENGDMYIERGDFEKFNALFFSYDYSMVKPDKDFFNIVLEKLGAKPYEVLLIDDHEKNTAQGEKLGMAVKRWANKSQTKLRDELKALGILTDKI